MSEVRLPVQGEYVRTVGKLVAVEDVTPKVTTVTDYIFEDQEATIEVWTGEHLLKTLGTRNDWYGEGTAVESAIEDAKEMAAKLNNPTLEIRVVKKTSQRRMRPDPHERDSMMHVGIRSMKQLDHGCRRDLPDDKEEIA